jgi:hypothetical protein
MDHKYHHLHVQTRLITITMHPNQVVIAVGRPQHHVVHLDENHHLVGLNAAMMVATIIMLQLLNRWSMRLIRVTLKSEVSIFVFLLHPIRYFMIVWLASIGRGESPSPHPLDRSFNAHTHTNHAPHHHHHMSSGASVTSTSDRSVTDMTDRLASFQLDTISTYVAALEQMRARHRMEMAELQATHDREVRDLTARMMSVPRPSSTVPSIIQHPQQASFSPSMPNANHHQSFSDSAHSSFTGSVHASMEYGRSGTGLDAHRLSSAPTSASSSFNHSSSNLDTNSVPVMGINSDDRKATADKMRIEHEYQQRRMIEEQTSRELASKSIHPPSSSSVSIMLSLPQQLVHPSAAAVQPSTTTISPPSVLSRAQSNQNDEGSGFSQMLEGEDRVLTLSGQPMFPSGAESGHLHPVVHHPRTPQHHFSSSATPTGISSMGPSSLQPPSGVAPWMQTHGLSPSPPAVVPSYVQLMAHQPSMSMSPAPTSLPSPQHIPSNSPAFAHRTTMTQPPTMTTTTTTMSPTMDAANAPMGSINSYYPVMQSFTASPRGNSGDEDALGNTLGGSGLSRSMLVPHEPLHDHQQNSTTAMPSSSLYHAIPYQQLHHPSPHQPQHQQQHHPDEHHQDHPPSSHQHVHDPYALSSQGLPTHTLLIPSPPSTLSALASTYSENDVVVSSIRGLSPIAERTAGGLGDSSFTGPGGLDESSIAATAARKKYDYNS